MSKTNQSFPIGTPELLERLSGARRRVALRDGLRGAAWSALAALLVYGALRIAVRTSVSPPVGPGGGAWGWAAAALAVGLGLTALRVWRARPSLIEMARRADRRFGLDERLSTVVELGAARDDVGGASPVVAALFRDAAAHVGRVDPRRLVPIGVPRPAIVLAPLVVGLLALELLSPAGRAGFPSDADSFAAAASRDPSAAADLIRDIAALLRERAEREGDEDLRVVATSMEQLAAEVVEQEGGGSAAADELQQLMEQAAADADARESDSTGDPSSLTLEKIEEFLRDQADVVARADADTRELFDSDVLPPIGDSEAAEAAARARSNLEALRGELAKAERDGAPSEDELAAADSTADDSAAAEAADAQAGGAPSMNAPLTTGERPLANAELGGSLTNMKGEGGGNPTEGRGGGSNFVTGDRVEVPDVSSSRDFELPMEGGSRRRLPEEIVPQTKYTEVDETPLPAGDWTRSPQDHVTSGYVGVSYRDVAGRYFLSRLRLAEAEAEAGAAEP